ncbi:MAG TPA: DNA polymerase III subunit delta [Candidatus Alistipes avistercoris]|jgi:DNA polymerase-3 subunit delta'|uniref:DNA polymerase III n=2 Tax=root TaxID=1 RepID=A0A8S5S3A0_9CAUD|nr:DNA polymerase III subunit delta [uncultured Alistipes sp.]DAF45392.1 MAG TPA: DNA polymerase III [Siphoviridae sp. ctBLh2]HIX96414.1 DNA polymerase III subunit delta [Candidatus Alistipes avistercoris]
MRFADITGQDDLKRHLAQTVDAGRVSHAQLFTGASGFGTLALAVAYVQYLCCRHRHNGDSCGECPDCRQIEALAHPDLHLVFPVNKQGKKSGEVIRSDEFLPQFRTLFAERRGYFSPQEWYDRLDLGKTLKGMIAAREADEIIRKLSFKSFEADYKTMLVWLPETMNEEAANKILKILEEPWERTLFILVSEHPDRLLPTILSRTQEVCVPRIAPEVLEREAFARGVADPLQARNMARLADGDLLELGHLVAGESDAQRKEHFDLFCSLMRLSYNDKHLELVTWAEDAAQLSREQQRGFLRDAARLLRESYMLHAGIREISYLWGEELAFCTKFAPFVGSQNIEPLIAEIESASAQIAQNGNPTIVFTHFALSVSKMIKHL